MSYPPYRGGHSMGRGYGPPPGGPPYYSQHGGPVGPPRHPSPQGAYMQHSEYEANPPIMRGGPHGEPGGFGRGYGRGSVPHTPPRGGPGPAGMPPGSGRGRGIGPGSMSGFESGSNSEDPRSSGSGPRSMYANDCEIVVLSKAQQQYGEMVERQLREYGLTVDIMFPKSDIKPQDFLKPFAKLGTIFAVVIDSENEAKRHLHFYQFRGHSKPQFHKNVPLTVAYELINKKYNELKKNEIGIVPDFIKDVLHKLLEEDNLKDNEYTALVRFLQERRNRQNAFLKRTSNVIQEHKSDINSLVDTPEGQVLQKRILSILNSTSTPGASTDDNSIKNST